MGIERPLVCIVIENNTYPLDRRVVLQAHALTEHGYDVTVIAPAGRGQPSREMVDGIDVRRYPLRPADSAIGYLREYGTALLHISRLLWALTRERHPDVIQVCNPPDLLFLPVLPHKLQGTRFVFDLHDLAPEIYATRYAGGVARVAHPVMRLLERASVALADTTIATNASYRDHILSEDAGHPDRVVVVRTGPTIERFADVEPRRTADTATCVVGYVGMMGPQDGVETLVDVACELRVMGCTAFHFLLIGDGPCLSAIRERIRIEHLQAHFTLCGLVQDHHEVVRLLAGCDVCVVPDPWTPANDLSSFIKVIEYMALGRPIVASDLRETRRTAGDAALYVAPGDARAMAAAISTLAIDRDKRAAMARHGKGRIISEKLAWDFHQEAYLALYDRLTGRA